jgi:hypothetical protein
MSLSTNKELWSMCVENKSGESFLDGLVLGSLVHDDSHSPEEWMALFDDWKNSATEMGLDNDNKKISMYSAYLKTYNKGKETEYLRKRELKSILKQRDSTESGNDFTTNGKQETEELSEETLKQPAFSPFKKMAGQVEKEVKVHFNSNDQVKLISNENSVKYEEEVPSQKCSYCHKMSNKNMNKNSCGHYVHSGCLKMQTISALCFKKYEVRCSDKSCNIKIDREVVVSVIDLETKSILDTFNFLNDYSTADSSRIVYWCHRCRFVNVKYVESDSKCIQCCKKQDKIKTIFTLVDLILKRNAQSDQKNYQAIKKCVEDCSTQLQRCESCLVWKHKFPGTSLKCLC